MLGCKSMEQKTNVMRLLEQAKINYTPHFYFGTKAIGGMEVAAALGQNPEQVFKTLVTVGKSGGHYVFVIPVGKELNLKKAAACVREKSISMIKEKELLPLTGYIHGGCSPIGMKKVFPTVFDETAQAFETICFSGGKIGCQVELHLNELHQILNFSFGNLTEISKK